MCPHEIDTVAFFDALASEMNAHPEEYDILGDIELRLAIVMERDDGSAFRALVTFDGIECTGVATINEGDEHGADCWIAGGAAAWRAMFDDIVAHGRAEGRQTINSLTMLGHPLAVHGDDPLGVDKFFRFNQSVQHFFDGAANAAVPA
jgi:hypothetical protein